MTLTRRSPALEAYESLAPHYDLLTAGYEHRRWIAALHELVIRHGLPGRRVLDLACGTGRAVQPLVALGYTVTGCDLSPAMLEVARRAAPAAELFSADMRELPDVGRFDLVLCLDDTVNYLLSEDDLGAAMRSVARVLETGGLLVFDVNTRVAYEGPFARDRVVSDPQRLVAWRGHGLQRHEPQTARATVEIFARLEGSELWQHAVSEHIQRHWRHDELTRALQAAGMALVRTVGQRTGAVLEPDPDAGRHVKVVYVARRV
ncbi:MAG: class I SAM-dependent methyltransferase [Actinomycetota bacterium]|nr:class I SAM-dependent methyltransferase [Actinomycetota bacterium]